LAGNATRVFVPSLEYLDGQIAKALLVPSLIGATSDQSQGSYARAAIHFDTFLLTVEALRRDLAVVINQQVLRPMLMLNFPELDQFPKWSWLPLTDDLRLELLRQWTALVTGGVVTPSDADEPHIRRMVQFPERRGNAVTVPRPDGAPAQQVNGRVRSTAPTP
jgi:hypothetical protein